MTVTAHKEQKAFQAEVTQVLHLLAKNIYGNSEAAIRELVSNASDALEKRRFEGNTNAALAVKDPSIKIEFDDSAKTISIHDNGIGMSRDEVIANIGTIAQSGTRKFAEALSQQKDGDQSQLIGQFGIGFYSAFIIADKVTVITRRADQAEEAGVKWESDGEGEYSIENCLAPEVGTHIILHIKKDYEEFLDHHRLRGIIRKYSDHISFPILMKPIPEPKGEEDKDEEDKTDEDKTDEDKAEESKTKQPDFETVNRATALWTRSKKDVSDEDYQEFYKYISHDFEDPMTWIHKRVEGKFEYINLLFIPKRAPFDLWNRETPRGLKLYVQRVFIMDDAEQFLPLYLRFVKGVLDCNDLPLNVSREMLQNNKMVESIRNALTKQVLDKLTQLAENQPEEYRTFWQEFGNVIKEGTVEDYANREKIAKLLRFASTHEDKPEQNVTLADYISRMPEGQEKIYYITAENFSAAQHSPHLEIFRKKGIEVLLMYDRVDEWLANHLSEFEGKQLTSISKGDLDLGDLDDKEDEAAKKEEEKSFESILKQMQGALKDNVKEVRITHRLTDSPACIVADEHDMGGHMQRILKSAGQNVPASKPIFEINPKHALVLKLKAEQDDDRFNQWSQLLFDQAILADGGELTDAAGFVKRMNTFLLEV